MVYVQNTLPKGQVRFECILFQQNKNGWLMHCCLPSMEMLKKIMVSEKVLNICRSIEKSQEMGKDLSKILVSLKISCQFGGRGKKYKN